MIAVVKWKTNLNRGRRRARRDNAKVGRPVIFIIVLSKDSIVDFANLSCVFLEDLLELLYR